MGKVEAAIQSEIERLARKELRKVSIPLKRDVRFRISFLFDRSPDDDNNYSNVHFDREGHTRSMGSYVKADSCRNLSLYEKSND
jgi:hypothetical protein